MIPIRLIVPLLLIPAVPLAQSPDPIAAEVEALCASAPFPMKAIPVPAFPAAVFGIKAFGGKGDGRFLNTAAFSSAITACWAAGGGTVNVPAGTWLTGPIELLSNVNLHVESGALVQFTDDIDAYPVIEGPSGTSRRFIRKPPLSAFRAVNIGVTGEGIFDGNGDRWRYVKRYKCTPGQWSDLVMSGGVVNSDSTEWWPSPGAMGGEIRMKLLGARATADDARGVREFLRPDLVVFEECTGVLIDGPTFQNSPRFHLRPSHSEQVIIRGITVRCPWYAQNGDGIDPASCRNVVITRATVDVGDDGICLKPGSLSPRQEEGPACENIIVADCAVYHAHGGFVIGSESYGGVKNVFVSNCIFSGTDVGLRFKSYRGNGGTVERVFVDGIQMREIATDAILFDMYYAGNSPDKESVKDLSVRKEQTLTGRTPRFRDIQVSNVVCTGAGRAMLLNGLPECKIERISFTSVSIDARQGAVVADAKGIVLKNCGIRQKEGAAFRFIDSRDVSVEGGEYVMTGGTFLSAEGEGCDSIRLAGAGAVPQGAAFRFDRGAAESCLERLP
jgi:polygalacturonase